MHAWRSSRGSATCSSWRFPSARRSSCASTPPSMPSPESSGFDIDAGEGVLLAGEQSGEGVPIVLLHGLTATRRYVVMGSRVLQREGHRVIAYDARGHGRSSAAPEPASYTYELLAGDLRAVLDDLEIE